MANRKIKLGDEVEDITSKTWGIAIAEVKYLSGAKAWIIQPYTIDDNQMLRTQEVPDAYCVRRGEGVYPKPKPPMGFHARETG